MSAPPGPSSAMKPSLSLSRPSQYQRPAARLALRGVGPLHQTRVVRAHHEGALGVPDAHQRDEAVLVEILRAVFVDSSVVVGVERGGVGAAQRFHRREHQLGAVGVHARDDVDHAGVETLLDGGIRGIALGQRIHHEQREFAADQVIAFEVGRHQQPGALIDGRARQICQFDGPDFATFASPADRRDPRDGRVRCDDGLQFGGEFLVGVELREVGGGRHRRQQPDDGGCQRGDAHPPCSIA